MLLADFGTSYCKLLDTSKDDNPRVIPTRGMDKSLFADLATGHNAKKRSKHSINELTALAKGGEKLIAENNFVLLDCGSRDTKFVRYENGKVADMGWNAECGASMGFTIELLASYYKIDYKNISVPSKTFSITCGVLGLSQIFDDVINGIPEIEAVARFVRGIALNGFRFAGSPHKLYLSGGLCYNPLFVACLPCEVVVLGRYVLLEGLRSILIKEDESCS